MCTAYVSVCIWRRCNNTQIVVYICWRVVCEAWTSQANTNVSNGSRVDASKLELCQRACFSNSQCDGLDWVHNAADGQRCWLSGPWSGTRNIGTASGAVTHYDFNRNCHTQGNHWPASRPISLSNIHSLMTTDGDTKYKPQYIRTHKNNTLLSTLLRKKVLPLIYLQ